MSESTPQHPSSELLSRLREGKRELHAAHRTLSAAENVRMVIELRRFTLPINAKRHAPMEIERPWPMDDERGSEA
jgi:hypothetical protein